MPVLKELDPSGAYDEAAKVTAEAVTKYCLALAEAEKPGFEGQPPGWKHDPINGQMNRLLDVLGNRINAASGSSGSGRTRVQRIPLEEPWGHLLGFCGAIPVCDGSTFSKRKLRMLGWSI